MFRLRLRPYRSDLFPSLTQQPCDLVIGTWKDLLYMNPLSKLLGFFVLPPLSFRRLATRLPEAPPLPAQNEIQRCPPRKWRKRRDVDGVEGGTPWGFRCFYAC